MAPRRRSSKPVTPDPNQRSIADFFSFRTSATAQPSPQPKSSRPRATPSKQFRAVQSVASPESSNPHRQPIRDRFATNQSPDPRTPSPVKSDPMQVDSHAVEEELPLTQEELAVHDSLQALECSRDEPERSTSKSPSPPKRARDASSSGSPKRKRASPLRGPLSAAGLLPGARSNALDRAPSPGLDAASESDDDSYADLREHAKEEVAAQPLRRSSRLGKETERFNPGAIGAGGSVFGSGIFGGSVFGVDQSDAKSCATTLRALAREKNARAKEEQKIEEMKKDILNARGSMGENEAMFENMAKAAVRDEQQRMASWEKFSAPIPLFSGAVCMEKLPRNIRQQSKDTPSYALHDALAKALSAEEHGDIALSMLPIMMRKACLSDRVRDLFVTANVLYHLIVYDETKDLPGRVSRDCLVESLEFILASKSLKQCRNLNGKGELPSLSRILKSYGAVFEDEGNPLQFTLRASSDEGLDGKAQAAVNAKREEMDRRAQAPSHVRREGMDSIAQASVNATRAQELQIITRNLQRAFVLAAARLRNHDSLSRIVSPQLRGKSRADSVLYSLGICTRVLLSVFGNRLHREVSPFIIALLDQIPEMDWPQFRTRAAKYILSCSSRLELHIELVTYLLPFSTNRARMLALDVSYLSLLQWAGGPGNGPQPKDVQQFGPSDRTMAAGITEVSYCVADVTELMRLIPTFAKTTDVEWACFLSKALKQCLADRNILDTRKKGDIGALNQLLQKLKTDSHRMPFEVAVQEMRNVLEALIMSVRDLLGNSKTALAEIEPNVRTEKVQSRLSGVAS